MAVGIWNSLIGGSRSGTVHGVPVAQSIPLDCASASRQTGVGKLSALAASTATAEEMSTRADPVPGALRVWVSELSHRKMWIYWADFLASLSAGYLAFLLFPLARPFTLRAALTFTVAVFALYRAVIFTHEIAHMPGKDFFAFRFTWNLICGVPLLVPSFLYEMHYQHHSRLTYGSAEDGEYLSFARLPRRTTVLYVLSSSLALPVLVARFLVLAPLRWIYPPLNRFVLTRASALAIDGEYERPLKQGPTPRPWVLQETACFAWCVLIGVLTLRGSISAGRLLEAAAVVTAIVLVNSLRTLGAHRYCGAGEPMSFAEQVRDSNDFPSILAELWAPVGLRYHAMHHLFPQLPYHALPEARRRILAWSGPHNPIRESARSSLFSVLRELMRKHRVVS
jgi:fatty acid desaturase